MRPIRVSPAALLAALSLVGVSVAACGENPTPSTSDPAVTPADGVTPPRAEAPLDPAPAPVPMPTPGAQGGTADWRKVASAEHAANLGRLDQAWRLGRAEAEDKGFASQVEALGNLVDPNAGLNGRLQPAPGAYRCRTIKLGSHDNAGPGYLEYPWFRCTVELTPGGDLILTKTTGSQRTRGLLYPDTDSRLIFIGAAAWGMDETGYPPYGQDRRRDQVGVFERIGPDRYRVVIPWPAVDSKLEILELVR